MRCGNVPQAEGGGVSSPLQRLGQASEAKGLCQRRFWGRHLRIRIRGSCGGQGEGGQHVNEADMSQLGPSVSQSGPVAGEAESGSLGHHTPSAAHIVLGDRGPLLGEGRATPYLA